MMDEEREYNIRLGLNEVAEVVHLRAVSAGWWDLPFDSFMLSFIQNRRSSLTHVDAEALLKMVEALIEERKILIVGAKIALIHSEISEALEGFRKNLMDDHLPHRKMVDVELADAVIRIGDLAGHLKSELGDATVDKIAYNLKRQDHTREARAAENGKKI